jgi:hypothetical protein
MDDQCDMSTGAVIVRNMLRVTPAKHELAQTRVAVAAHYDEIHVLISRM